MDALPIAEANQFAHRSTYPNKMHACGHDGHTAMLLGAARYLAESKPFDGTVVLIFQPGEEGGAGAQRMIDDGLFDKFPCDAVFGMHNWPGMAVGQFGVAMGPAMASASEFQITVDGRGAHAALPHLGVDPVFVAVQIAQGTAQAHGAAARVEFRWNYPPTVNHRAEAEFAARVMDDIVGSDNVQRDLEPTMGSEDFAFMLKARPGAYVFIGNGDGSYRAAGHGLGPCTLHNPSFDFNDELIPLGATFWVRLVEKFLPR